MSKSKGGSHNEKKVLIVTASVIAGAAALMALGRYIKGPRCLFEDDEEEEYEPDEEFHVDLDEGTPDPLETKDAESMTMCRF